VGDPLVNQGAPGRGASSLDEHSPSGVLVEEHSMEVFLAGLLPRLLGQRATFTVHAHQGKSDLLAKLAPRLRAYAKWLPATWRIVVVVDRDRDDCRS